MQRVIVTSSASTIHYSRNLLSENSLFNIAVMYAINKLAGVSASCLFFRFSTNSFISLVLTSKDKYGRISFMLWSKVAFMTENLECSPCVTANQAPGIDPITVMHSLSVFVAFLHSFQKDNSSKFIKNRIFTLLHHIQQIILNHVFN